MAMGTIVVLRALVIFTAGAFDIITGSSARRHQCVCS
jgi:hypothetical protein